MDSNEEISKNLEAVRKKLKENLELKKKLNKNKKDTLSINYLKILPLVIVVVLLICFGYIALTSQSNNISINQTSIVINPPNSILNILAVLIGTFSAFLLTILWNDYIFKTTEQKRKEKIISSLQKDLEHNYYVILYNKDIVEREINENVSIINPLTLFSIGFWDLIKVDSYFIENSDTSLYLSNVAQFKRNINETIRVRENFKIANPSVRSFELERIIGYDKLILSGINSTISCLKKVCEELEFKKLLEDLNSLDS